MKDYSKCILPKQRESYFSYILVFVSIFYIVFFPTSINGNIIGNMFIVRNLSAAVIAFYLVWKNALSRNAMRYALILLSWLSFLTMTTHFFYRGGVHDLKVAWASISSFLPTLLIWCVNYKHFNLNRTFAVRCVNALSIIFCVWGWTLVLKNALVINFTQSLYSQLTESMFNNMIILRGKPVMSFGTHSIAAFFIMIVFYLNCIVVKESAGSKLQYLFMVFLWLLEIPLTSNTAFFCMTIMLLLLVWAKNTPLVRSMIIFMVLVVVGYIFFSGMLDTFVGKINYNSDSHGFKARYLTDRYAENFNMIIDMVGVGFLRSTSGSFNMKDSGIIYILTQGNLFALIICYWLMYSFFKRNLQKHLIITFSLLFLWEFVDAATYVMVRMVFTHLLMILLINGICRKESQSENGSAESINYLMKRTYLRNRGYVV